MLGFGYRIFLCGFMGYIYLESRPGGRRGGFFHLFNELTYAYSRS